MPSIVGAIEGQRRFSNRYYNKDEILNAAHGRWPYILSMLGIQESCLKNKHGPCPMCGGKDRFRFDDKMLGAFICTNCGSGYGITFLQKYHGWDFPTTLSMIAGVIGYDFTNYQKNQPPYKYHDVIDNKKQLQSSIRDKRAQQYIDTILRQSKAITEGDPVNKYLQNRGLVLTDFPATLKYHPALDYYEDKRSIGTFAAMIAKVTNVDNECIVIHRTYLNNGSKAAVTSPKKLTSPVYPHALIGAAIRLYEPIDGLLIVSEGIETALAIYLATKIPVWAALNDTGMKNIILPKSVTEVLIAVDNDQSGAGQKAALALSRRLLSEGRKVKRITPQKINSDFNDLLNEVKL